LNEINEHSNNNIIEIITPLDEKERGCQVSILMLKDGKRIFDELLKAGIIADWREPNVIRVAPVPLYNTFEDIFNFGKVIKESLIK
jgi:kynureninase